MKTRQRKQFFWGAGLAVPAMTAALMIAAALVYLMTSVPYRPPEAVRRAEEFVSAIVSAEMERAYTLTSREAPFGNSFQEFVAAVDAEIGAREIVSIRVRDAWPFQSYGNRLRRWLTGRQVEMPEISVDFLLETDAEGSLLPFEVRQTYLGNGTWAVTYFQVHAL